MRRLTAARAVMRRLTATAAVILVAAGCPARAAGPGETLFRSGAGAEVVLVGSVRLPAARFACAGCHGADGRGGGEGATAFPPIVWDALAAPDRPGGPYDTAAFVRAVAEGVAPDGRALRAAMPRFDTAEATLRDLAAYLAGLSAAETAGITATEVRVARPADPAAARGLALGVARMAAQGTIWGRRVTIAESGPVALPAATLTAAATPAILRATAAVAVDALRAEGIGTVDPGPAPPRDLLAALAAAGIAVEPGAATRVCLNGDCPDDGRAILVGLDALPSRLAAPAASPRTRLVTVDGSGAAQLLEAGARAAAVTPYLAAAALESALAECGRALTRTCLVAALPRADLRPFLRVYGR